MEISSHEGEIPMPLNSSFGHGHGHMIHHDHHNHIPPQNQIIPSSPPQLPSSNNGTSSNTAIDDPHRHHATSSPPPTTGLKKSLVKYKECLKNHAASMGGNATDGCGEFMPSGEEGTIEALTCSACNCHRNFHRKEIQGNETNPFDYYLNRVGRKLMVGHHHNNILGYPTGKGTLVPLPPPPHHHQMIMPYNMSGSLPSESDEQEDGGCGGGSGSVAVMARPHQNLVKKRFRTKFSQEQKEKMLQFAEKIGWKMQKQEEDVIQQFCQEIGVKRRVLKVWMHNNKHNLAKKNPLITITSPPPTTATT